MHLATRQPGNCALCAFRSSGWEPLIGIASRGKRPYRKSAFSIRRIGSRLPPEISQRKVEKASRDLIPAGSLPPSSSESIFRWEDLRYSLLSRLIFEQWSVLRHQLGQWQENAVELEGWGIKNKAQFRGWAAKFQKELEKSCAQGVEKMADMEHSNLNFGKLRRAFLTNDLKGVAAELKHSFASFVVGHGFTKVDIENQKRLADLRYPLEWYPETRAMQRKIHLHVGPTNSGKTYQALQRLEAAESGIYAGPLRLLAHEVYTRLNAKNKPCALITGEERRIPEGHEALMSSCTVEMVPLNTTVDVAVIDEIQMMGDIERGWAWTQALLGVKAKEVHLCGELRTIPLVQDLCAMMGDSLDIHQYKRLSPLKAMNSSLKGDLKKLERGDAIILFSRLGIHAIKKEVEMVTGKRCAVVYGSLPPETRAQQANLFNDPDNDYDFLVASDAVGMGLNLSIKRIIFEATSKHDGTSFRAIEVSEIKQIAGRAGRYRTAAEVIKNSLAPKEKESATKYPLQLNVDQEKPKKTAGLVTTLDDFDMPLLQRAMSTEVEPLTSAGILPPTHILSRFAAYFPPKTPFSYILLRLHEVSSIHPHFHLCRSKDQIAIADVIQPFDLTISDRSIFIAAPANFRDEGMEAVMKAFAKCVADQSGGELLDIQAVNLELLDKPADVDGKEYLRKLEALHKALTLYLWLSYRFAGVFRSQVLAFHVKSLVEEKIDACLAQVQMSPEKRKLLNVLRQRAVLSEMSTNPTPKVEVVERPRDTKVALPSSWEGNVHNGLFLDVPEKPKAQQTSMPG